ncbi:hypothetical protein NDA11_002969 [Ustilago hordei]|nr:hypothetical protein NDA11_002969 [Ustilago hordei]
MSDRAVSAVEEEVDYEGLGGNVPLHINMIAGSLAGISEHAVMFPVDVIRTRMQVLSATPAATYTGVVQAFNRISTLEGARTLWRGVASVIMGAGPAHAVYFGTYETVKEATGGNREGHQFASTAFAGASATIAADAFMNPFDVIKQRMMHGSQHRTVMQCASTVYKQEGLRAFYVSYPTTLTMTVPFTAVQFSVYEWAKKVLNPSETYSPMTHVSAGAFSGAVAAAVTNPPRRSKDIATDTRQQYRSTDPQRIRHA